MRFGTAVGRPGIAAALALASAAWAQGPAWEKVFDGKSMAGWQYDSSYWSVDSGMLVGQGKSDFNTFCNLPRKYSDFVLSAWTRLWETPAGYTNSGIQYRSAFIDSATHRMQGYQWDVGEGYDGAMYPENSYPAGVNPHDIPPACRATINRNGWNHVLITANGATVRHELNGVFCFEYTASVLDGYIGLQLHASTVVTKVDFRDLYIRPLNNSFAVPDSAAAYLQPDFTSGAESIAIARNRNVTLAPRGFRFSPAGNAMLFPLMPNASSPNAASPNALAPDVSGSYSAGSALDPLGRVLPAPASSLIR